MSGRAGFTGAPVMASGGTAPPASTAPSAPSRLRPVPAVKDAEAALLAAQATVEQRRAELAAAEAKSEDLDRRVLEGDDTVQVDDVVRIGAEIKLARARHAAATNDLQELAQAAQAARTLAVIDRWRARRPDLVAKLHEAHSAAQTANDVLVKAALAWNSAVSETQRVAFDLDALRDAGFDLGSVEGGRYGAFVVDGRRVAEHSVEDQLATLHDWARTSAGLRSLSPYAMTVQLPDVE